MKILLKKLTIRNFMSYGNADQTFILENPGTTLIVGEDLDNTTDGKSANGTGKSTIINALSYVLYDKPVSNISVNNLVNNINKKNMVVTLEFSVGEDEYVIKRERKTKAGAGGNNVTFIMNGVDKSRSSAETNRDIEAVIGFPHELFVRIVVFSASHLPFLDLPTTSQTGVCQKDFIEELFGLTALTTKAEQLKQVMKDTKSSIDTKRVYIQAAEGEHERHAIQVDSAKRRVLQWETTTSQAIAECTTMLKRVDSIDIAAQKQLHTTLSELKTQQRELRVLVRETKSQVDSLVELESKISTEMSDLHDATCPYCKQEYAAGVERAKTCGEEIASIQSELSVRRSEYDSAVVQFDAVQAEIDTTEGLITVSDIDELMKIASERDQIAQKIKDLEAAVNPYLDPLDELENMNLVEIDYSEIDDLTKLLTHQEFLLKLLTKKDSFVRKALLDKSIPYLNAQLKSYLTALGLPHSVTFTHEMTASISRFGTPLDFGNLSAGQRARVNLALSFAFRNVLQNLHSSINICMLDEVFDIGLDAVGVQLAVRLVKQKTREEGISMFIISHKEEVTTQFDRVLKVQFSKGFSTIAETVALDME